MHSYHSLLLISHYDLWLSQLLTNLLLSSPNYFILFIQLPSKFSIVTVACTGLPTITPSGAEGG